MSAFDLESFIEQIDGKNEVKKTTLEDGPDLSLTAVLTKQPDTALRLVEVNGYTPRVVSGLMATKERVALALGTEICDIPKTLETARRTPSSLQVVDTIPKNAPFLHNPFDTPDLSTLLPLGRFYPGDGGPYCTAFVVAAHSPSHGMNLSFHRMMHLKKNRFAVRVVKRHLHSILSATGGELRVAAFCGVHPAVLLAAALSASPDLDELKVASQLLGGDLPVVEMAPDIYVPAHSQVVFVGRFTGETTAEGPFVDLTGTYDTIREQPVLEVETLWMRDNPLYHAILPGGREHKMLMGLPREPSILDAARSVSPGVKEVNLTQGGCSWLHAVLQVEGLAPGQAVNVGLAALGAHASLKKVTIVDGDIDICASEDVEWAEATRVQPHRDITIINRARGSTLDPSRDTEREITSKWIVDATRPPGHESHFVRAALPKTPPSPKD